MNYRQTLFLCLLMLMGVSTAFSQSVKSYTISKITAPITIDGQLNERVWTLARNTPNFVVLGSNQTAQAITNAKMLWDDTFLYIAFVCQDEKVWATFTRQDDPLYQEDVVEVYIDPDGDGKNYLEIEVNPLNTVFDLWLTKPRNIGGQDHTEWTMQGLQAVSFVDGSLADNSDKDKEWICEMALPFSEMQFAAPSRNYPPAINDRWRFNLYRFDRSYTNNSVGEATGWSPTNGDQHEPDKFGVITFAGLMTDVEHDQHNLIADNFQLFQNYPNPFNPTTIIKFNLQQSAMANLTIFDLAGREIETLVDAYTQAGEYQITWTAHGLASGVYFYKLTVDNFTITKKLVLQK